MVVECGLTFGQIDELGIYEIRLLQGYREPEDVKNVRHARPLTRRESEELIKKHGGRV